MVEREGWREHWQEGREEEEELGYPGGGRRKRKGIGLLVGWVEDRLTLRCKAVIFERKFNKQNKKLYKCKKRL